MTERWVERKDIWPVDRRACVADSWAAVGRPPHHYALSQSAPECPRSSATGPRCLSRCECETVLGPDPCITQAKSSPVCVNRTLTLLTITSNYATGKKTNPIQPTLLLRPRYRSGVLQWLCLSVSTSLEIHVRSVPKFLCTLAMAVVLAALRYIMYCQFYGWRHTCT